ncbi:MAG: MerR family transcriptional regulator [Gammaproteobacteria bacterium]|jgi:DNA-binding transcriptional MerR regulator|nr:MerR family transcriptional regulator [Gammaproteobacteria bacterium]
MMTEAITIGELAKRVNVATSLLRFYEREKILLPVGRTDSGYRLYRPEAEHTLRFVRSAQRCGFSLKDIKLILSATGEMSREYADLRKLTEQRFLDIEQRTTEMLVLRHELELFRDDLIKHLNRPAGEPTGEQFRDLIERACGHSQSLGRPSFTKLFECVGCKLADDDSRSLLSEFRGRHVHIWWDDDGYSILFAEPDAKLEQALKRLVQFEADCKAHPVLKVSSDKGGLLLHVGGPNAFIFGQIFLLLEFVKT